MCATIAFPVSSITMPHGVLHLCSTTCQSGDHAQCSGQARFPDTTIECTCTCHDAEQFAAGQNAPLLLAA